MKATKIIILFLFIALFSKAQEKSLQLGITGGVAQYDYSFWEFPDTITYHGFPLQNGNHKFVNKINFETGILANYNINNLLFGISFLYSAKDYIVDYDFDTATAKNGEIALGIDKSILRFRYFDLNFNFGYILLPDKKINVIPTLSLGAGFLINSESKMIGNDGSTFIDKENTDNIVHHNPEKFVYNASIGVIITYNINDKLSAFVNPYVKRYGVQVTPDPMNDCPMVYGANIGINIKLKKSTENDENNN